MWKRRKLNSTFDEAKKVEVSELGEEKLTKVNGGIRGINVKGVGYVPFDGDYTFGENDSLLIGYEHLDKSVWDSGTFALVNPITGEIEGGYDDLLDVSSAGYHHNIGLGVWLDRG